MPKPSRLGPYRIIAFAIEIDKYQMLREIAFNKGISISELLRDIIDEYLEREGVLNAEVVAMNGGLKTLSLIEQKLLASELQEIMQDLDRLSKHIKRYPRGTISWYDCLEKMRGKIRRALIIIQKIGVPSDNTLRKLRDYSEFVEKITGANELFQKENKKN